MILQRPIGTQTEIYVEGGGVITENFPTNFHNKYTRKILNKNETIDDYKYVTDEEFTKIKSEDSSFECPSDSFIEQWNIACGKWGTYNLNTGFFELNGLKDITLKQAKDIYYAGPISSADNTCRYAGLGIRTNLPPIIGSAYSKSTVKPINCSLLAWNCPNLEILNLTTWGTTKNPPFGFMIHWEDVVGSDKLISGCTKLHTILGAIDIGLRNNKSIYGFLNGMTSIVNVKLLLLRTNAYIPALEFLSSESIKYMIENKDKSYTNPITVTVHPDIYARMTDESNAEWHDLLLKGIEKNITFTTTDEN